MLKIYGLLLIFGTLVLILPGTGGQWGPPPEFEFGPGPMGPPPPWVRRHWRRRFCFRHPDHPRCWGMPPPGPSPFEGFPPPPRGWEPEGPWESPPPQPQPQPPPRLPPAPAPPPRIIPAPPPRPRPPPPVPIRRPPPLPPRPAPPPVTMPPPPAVPHGPPAPLARFVRDIKFGHLDAAPRQALISSCTSRRVACRQILPSAQTKRSSILNTEVQIQRKFNPRTSTAIIDARMNRLHQVKQQLLATSGLSAQIIPQNDGTFEEDVLLTDTQSTSLLNSLRTRRKRSGVYGEGFPSQVWPKRRHIPYAFDVSLLPANQIIVRNALREIETKTCIRFQYYSRRPNLNHIYYTKISSSTVCGLSYIGKVSPANPIYLSFACPEFTGIVIHETLHALGIIHQHLRSDRDQHIRMEWSNINPQYYDQFAIADSKMFTTYGVPYDYYSIMHYRAYVTAIDPRKPTMTPLSQTARVLQVLGQRQKLSDRDIELLNAMYCSSDVCIDRNVYCGVWALLKLCTSRDNGDWLSQNCKKSCGFCK